MSERGQGAGKAPAATQASAGVQRKSAPTMPGKRTRTMNVQAKGGARGPGRGADVQQVAADGVSGAGAALPFGGEIQRSFGKHDVSGVEAHVGGAATAACDNLDAVAYATGTHVAFSESPTLHTAAHEAAHVVQQRAGVQLKGGVGEAGDAHERHADAVADAVVAGRPAEPLLDQVARSGATRGSAAVQMEQRDRTDDRETPGGQPDLGNYGQPYESTFEAMEAEAFLWATLLPASAAMFGTEVANLWRMYLSREPGDSLDPVIFDEGAGSAVAFAFKHCSEIGGEQNAIMDLVIAGLSSLPELPPNQWHSEPLSTFVGATPYALSTNFSNPYNTPGHIAGGAGASDAGPDTRSVDGVIRFMRQTDEAGVTTQLLVEPQLNFEVFDCIDFIPGNPGTGQEQRLTIPLSRLEASGRAYDVPFRVTFTGPVARRTVPASELGGLFPTNPEDATRQERQRTPAEPREDERSRSRWGHDDPGDLREGANPDDSRRRDF